MEINRGRSNTSSGDKFSFPIPSATTEEPDQFEFGCVTTPGSPNSPADRLFSNGKLLPHVFPIDQYQNTVPYSYSFSRSTSRTSSISSKDSQMSSRSNSTNSRSSNCSSARTSTSEASERRSAMIAAKNIPARKERNRPPPPPVLSSQRWQLMAAAPAPVLKHQGSRSRKTEINLDRKGSKRSTTTSNDDREEKWWFGKRVLKSFMSTCKECHGIKTGTVEGAVTRSLEV